jgi:murein DD-endopeptidase MepM/ murein hydrolase activator NlpD
VPGTFLNLKIKGGIHVVLQRKLHEAERWLEAQPKYSGMSHSQIAKELGLNAKTAFSGARISPAKQAMHGFGLAVDIDVFGNPWIGAGWVKHDPVFLKERYRMLSVLKIASGQNLQDKNIFEYLHSISVSAGTETMTAYSILKEKNDQFVHHLKSNPEELKYWTKSQTFGKRNPLKGFLNLHQDLVFALRQVAGLAWGAIDFGPKASGDIMHFDMRTLGVGKFLCEKIKGYVPKSGHPEIQNEYEYEYEMMDTNVDNYMGESIELHEAVEEEEWEDESFMNDDFYFESYNNIDTFENDSEYENQYENDEFLENEEDFFEQESQYEDFDLEYEYEDHESYDEYLIKDISKAVMDNRYYKRVLGWGLHYDQINKILLPYSGQSNISLAESDFAIALSKWQASKGFAPNEADGVLGPHTWNKLETQLNIKTSTGFEPSINSSVSPVSDPVISSEFSNQRKQPVTGNLVAHYGIDIVDSVRSKTLGKTVVSATDGKISSIKYKSDGNGAGNRIHIIDDAGYKHSYFHLSDHNFGINLSSGGRVTKGQKIGEIGNTGRSSGPHLHYETVHPNGTKMNPRLINAGLRMAPNKHEVREFEYEYEFEYS